MSVRIGQFGAWWRMGLVLILVTLAQATLIQGAYAATVRQEAWGNSPAGDPVSLYTIDVGTAELQVTNYGARIVSIRVPDRRGHIANVVLTREHPDGYSTMLGPVMGATIGRYANRIAGGQIQIDGVTSTLAKSNGPNTLHGGPAGFNTKVWTARAVRDGVEMTLESPDGDMGFPGALTVHVLFGLSNKSGKVSVSLSYQATTTRPTVVNFTNHTFFNLSGDPDMPVLSDLATIAADGYTPSTGGIPVGTIDPVAGTALDFRTPRAFGAGIPDRGYDNNFVLRAPGVNHLAAQVEDPGTGRTVQVYTTEPGLQLFVPHDAPASPTASTPAVPYRGPAVRAFCLETQHFPDSPHHANFPDTTLRPGHVFRSETVYVFTANAGSA